MTNTNCLADMRCPRCGSEGPFDISAGALFTVADSGVEAYYGVEWNNDASCYCRQCQHDSIVNDFMIEHQTDTGPDVVSALLKAAGEALQALERVSDALHYEDGDPAGSNIRERDTTEIGGEHVSSPSALQIVNPWHEMRTGARVSACVGRSTHLPSNALTRRIDGAYRWADISYLRSPLAS